MAANMWGGRQARTQHCGQYCFLGMSRGVESQTTAWAGERVVRDDFTEVVTFRARL